MIFSVFKGLIAAILFWPLFRFFDVEEDLGRKNPFKSAKLIFYSIIISLTLTPFVLAFGAFYLIAQIIIVPFKWTLKMDLEEQNRNNNNNNGNGDRQGGENQPAAKKEVRWVKKDAQQFFYTANSRPELETDANTNATEGDIEAQILRRPQGGANRNNANNRNNRGNTVFDRAWQDYNHQTVVGFRIY